MVDGDDLSKNNNNNNTEKRGGKRREDDHDDEDFESDFVAFDNSDFGETTAKIDLENIDEAYKIEDEEIGRDLGEYLGLNYRDSWREVIEDEGGDFEDGELTNEFRENLPKRILASKPKRHSHQVAKKLPPAPVDPRLNQSTGQIASIRMKKRPPLPASPNASKNSPSPVKHLARRGTALSRNSGANLSRGSGANPPRKPVPQRDGVMNAGLVTSSPLAPRRPPTRPPADPQTGESTQGLGLLFFFFLFFFFFFLIVFVD
jgi:hypothetical protein